MLIRSLLITGGLLFLSTASFAQVDASITVAPPELPTYEQPMAPGDGYIWTPGYWAWDGDYYWVPGTWVMAPEPGYLWTPGYWGWGGNGYMFNAGYWGLSVGFYGGVNYGYGYYGHGYEGGRWESGHFFYNTSVNRVDANSMHNVYNTRVNEPTSRVSFNGGNGGINARASSEEEAAARGKRAGPVAAQTQHAYAARSNPQQKLSANHGAPPVTATARPNIAAHPSELPPARASAPNTGNPKLDQKYQKEQNQVVAQQNQQRQKLQQTQDREHQQLTKQNAPPARMQQAEQQHVQQTQQMAQRHSQQMQQVQQRQAPAAGGRGGRN
jgi:WXXGXW repeat (2 copies)